MPPQMPLSGPSATSQDFPDDPVRDSVRDPVRDPVPGPVPELVNSYVVYGFRPCSACEFHIEALCLGLIPFNHMPQNIKIRFVCMTLIGSMFIGGFRVIRRNSDVPAVTQEVIEELLIRNFHTPLIITQIPREESDNGDDSD